MKREILVSASDQESWVALKEDGRLAELMFDRPGQGRIVGDIFLGRVDAVLPGIQAAFVDIGEEKAAFLHASDVESGGNGTGRASREQAGPPDDRRRGRGRNAPPIQEALTRDQVLLVQVTKESISSKGPRVTTQISLPGRFLVYLPQAGNVGVSRKIGHRGERARLRAMAKEVVGESTGGVIVRTAGEELTPEKLEREYRELRRLWESVQRSSERAQAPALVHQDAKLVSSVVRDLFTDKFEAVTVDDRRIHQQVLRYVKTFDPELADRIHFYGGKKPLFDHAGIEDEIQQTFRRRVDLPSGGHVVIEQTEALVSVDVNTGRFTGKKRDPEDTILETNLDAAREIANQLRLRDVGGIVVIDFIDMERQQNRDQVFQELRRHLARDRARTRTWEVSELGLIEMSRQRVRPSLLHSLTEPCASCGGTGRVWTAPTLVREIERCVRRAAALGDEKQLLVRVHPQVALQVMEFEPRFVRNLARQTRLRLDLRDDPLLRHDEYRILSGKAQVDVTDKYRTA